MLRSPTHLVGHGPTSHSTTTTNSGSHRHIGQNGTTTKKQILFNGTSKHQHHSLNNNNNNGSSKQHNYDSTIITSSTTTTTTTQQQQPHHQHHQNITTTSTRTSLFDSCHRKIRLIGGGPVAFLGGLVAKARRKERDDQNSTDTKLYLEESVLERKLPDADLKALVDLPAGLDFNEWLASHTLALFEHVNLVYGTISEFCTPSGCPDMTGPGNRTYLWFDEKGKKTRVAAPQYIDYVMTFTQKTVSDESIFPTKYAKEFPSSFESIARKILRLQFHVIAHLYAAHFREIALLGLHTHLNLTFAHLTALHRRFNLIDEKETDVLRDLEVALRLTDDQQQQQLQLQQPPQPQNTIADSNKSDAKRIEDVAKDVDATSTQTTTSLSTTTTSTTTMVKPICTQPESMKALSNSDGILGGNNVNTLGGGILGSFTANDLIASDSSSFNNGTSHNNNSNSMLQCNSITTNSSQQHSLQHQHNHHSNSNSSSPTTTPSTTTTTA